MKKTIAIIFFICILLLVSCEKSKNNFMPSDIENGNIIFQGPPETDSQINDFINLIKSGEYLKAVEYYNTEIFGNYSHEYDSEQEILNLLDSLYSDILNGTKGLSDSDKLLTTIDRVMSDTDFSIDSYQEKKISIETALLSKVSYKSGCELENLKNYSDAISEYQKVIKEDSDYSSAQDAIKRCISNIKEEVFSSTAALVENNNFTDAISKLKELSALIPNDDEILSKITTYEKTYIKNTISESEKVFVNPETDYAQALSIINAGLQHYKDNEELNSKKTYYDSFAPINLYDMKKLKGSASSYDTDSDIYGNDYSKCFWTGYDSWMIWHDTDISYNLNNDYNRFTATIFSRSKSNDTQEMTVIIYGDGKPLYENYSIKDNSTKAFGVEINVTGISELRIVLTRNGGGICNGIGMTNMIVQKTVK